jgi:predicted Na+-dependent transporter
MEKKFKKIMAVIFVVTFLLVEAIGLIFGKVIEGSLFAEVAKWVFMGLLLAALVCGLSWTLVSIYLHRHNK